MRAYEFMSMCEVVNPGRLFILTSINNNLKIQELFEKRSNIETPQVTIGVTIRKNAENRRHQNVL